MIDINEIKKDNYPYDKITLKQIEYEAVTHNIDKLKKDITAFVGKNKTFKKYKGKAFNFKAQMGKILDRLSSENGDHEKLIKSLNFKRKNIRFMSAIEMEKYREQKSLILKFLNLKADKNKTTLTNAYKKKGRNISLKKIKLSDKFKNTASKFKINKEKSFHNEFRTSYLNQSTGDLSLFKDFISNDNKIYNYNNKDQMKNKFNDKNIIKIKKHFSFFGSDSTKSKSVSNLKLRLYESKDNEEQKNKEKNSKKIFFGIKSDFKINNNNIIPEDKFKMRRKIYLKNLEDKVDEFENCNKFYPNIKLMDNFKKELFSFEKEKNLNQIELEILEKKENKKIINEKKELKRSKSTPKIKLNKTLTPLRKNKYKLTSKSKDKIDNKKLIIKKLNIIKKKANIRKINMKTLYNKIDNSNKVVDYFIFNEGKIIDESMGEGIKNDIIKYKNELGNLVYVNGLYLFSSHLPNIKRGLFNINKY